MTGGADDDGIDRRTALKLAGATVGGLGAFGPGTATAHPSATAGETTGTRPTATGGSGAAAGDRPLEVGVFVTQEMAAYSRQETGDPNHAARVVEEYLQGAFDRTDRFDVEVKVADVRPDPPRDDVTSGPMRTLSGECICDSSKQCEWRKLLLWFREWYWDGWNDSERRPTPERCGESHARAVDANFLVARGTGGGESTGNAGRTCVATVGVHQVVADAEYQEFGYDDEKYKAIRASLHEIGHCLMNGRGISDEDGDGNPSGREHDMSEIVYDEDNDDYAITPMGIYGDQNNERTNEHPKHKADDKEGFWTFLPWVDGSRDGKPDGFAYFYSEATLDHFFRKDAYELEASGCGAERNSTTMEGRFGDGGNEATYSYAPRTDEPCQVTLTLDGPSGADFDLYVTLDGRTPTAGDHDLSSRSPGSRERVTVEDEDVQASQRLGILVRRYTGDGEFTLTVEERGS